MKLIKNPILMVLGVLALAIILSIGCAKTPKAPSANILPQTIITSYNISTAPDSATFYGVTVYYRASDLVGQAESYRYWVDSGDTTYTFDPFAHVRMNFTTTDTMHTFYVEARDNEGDWDPSPAFAAVIYTDIANPLRFNPNTVALTVPPDGALTSRGVRFVVSGTDLDGNVPNFQWAIDGSTDWTTVPATIMLSSGATLELSLSPSDISLGAHTVYIRAEDNFGNLDESPLSISFVAVDSLRPDLTVVSGPIPHAFYFLPGGQTTVNLAAAWFGDATWYFSSLMFRYAVDDTANWSEYTDATSATLTGLVAGPHTFTVEAMDLAGNTSIFQTDFGIGQLTGDRGLLVVNGVDWATYEAPGSPEVSTMYNATVPFGTHSFDFWDFFAVGSGVRPDILESNLIGEGSAIPGDTLGHYSSMVMLMNNFAASGPTDLDYYTTMFPLILSYLNGGGNVALGSRYGASYVYGDLAKYGITDDSLIFNTIGIALSGLTAAAPGLEDMSGGSSLNDLMQLPLPAGVTNLFNVNGHGGSSGGILIEPEGKGKFVYIVGRPYRLGLTAEAANYDYILTNYFGEH